MPPRRKRAALPAIPKAASKVASKAPPAAAPDVSPEAATMFRRRLHRWYRRHCRDLPWRRTRDPYHILISELMLQQTQVSRVLDYYARFLDRFPDLPTLASARPARVMEAWAGLGYYARARNLHKLAREVTSVRSGVIPHDPVELRTLPGIGAYTAGAVASFAYEKRAALVDTNVARVLHRVFAPDVAPKSGPGLKRLWRIAEQVLPRTGKATWLHNQAIMELGALVCTARSPKCGQCPVRQDCASVERFAAHATTNPQRQAASDAPHALQKRAPLRSTVSPQLPQAPGRY